MCQAINSKKRVLVIEIKQCHSELTVINSAVNCCSGLAFPSLSTSVIVMHCLISVTGTFLLSLGWRTKSGLCKTMESKSKGRMESGDSTDEWLCG